MSARRLALLNRGLVAGSAFAALILLALFYSVVSGHVDRAASQRAEMTAATQAPGAPVPQGATARGSLSGQALLLAGSPR
jgi:hypothetical protein